MTDARGMQTPARMLRVHAVHVIRQPGQSARSDGAGGEGVELAAGPFGLLQVKKTLAAAQMQEMRAATLAWLEDALGGDVLAAELVLLALVTR